MRGSAIGGPGMRQHPGGGIRGRHAVGEVIALIEIAGRQTQQLVLRGGLDSLDDRLHAEVADFRDVNSGSAHVGGRIRDGEYILRKTEENWSIGDYLPSK